MMLNQSPHVHTQADVELLLASSISRDRAVEILTSPETMAEFFGTRLSFMIPQGMIITECRPKVLRDRLGSRQVIAYRLFFSDRARRKAKPVVLVLKRYADKAEGKKTFFAMRLLWENGFNRQSRLRIPEPFLYLEDLGIQVQERVHGMQLRENLRQNSPVAVGRMRAVARWLTKLHQLDADLTGISIHPPEDVSIKDFVRQMGTREQRTFQPRLEKLASVILARLASFNDVPVRPVHGDFQCENIHVEGDEVMVVDFDRFCRSDPARDLGYIIAQMRTMAFLGHALDGSVHPGLKAFWDEYLSATPALDREALSARTCVFAARKCLQNIYYMAYVLPGEGVEVVSVLLKEAERFSTAEKVEEVLGPPVEVA